MTKDRIVVLIEKGANGSKYNLIFDYAIMILIALNVVASVLETIPTVKQQYSEFFYAFEFFSIIVFTTEYLLRIIVSDQTHPSSTKVNSAFRFIFSPFGLIDLFAILPFYLPLLFTFDLRFIRVLRLLRFIRIFKINRYNSTLNLLWGVIKDKRTELGFTFFLTFLILVISSFLMYHAEGDIQPNAFPNVLATFWWAVATLTTVGYGDVYPITGLGKFLSGTIALLGIGLIALPTGIISSGFMERIGKRKNPPQRCPHCGKEVEPLE